MKHARGTRGWQTLQARAKIGLPLLKKKGMRDEREKGGGTRNSIHDKCLLHTYKYYYKIFQWRNELI